jgi:hypothetical protein
VENAMKLWKRLGLLLLLLFAATVAVVVAAGMGWFGRHEEPGAIAGRSLPGDVVAGRVRTQRAAAAELGADSDKQILFGDLHVHTTFSVDAFFASLPALAGEGAHPPADACDFARYCSALDFWSINDHAEGLTPAHWRETVDSIRQCNAVAGDPADPDVVAFLGWEWTQVGATPEDHYGHKNVVVRHTDEARIPARPIASTGLTNRAMRGIGVGRRGLMAVLGGAPRYHGLARLLADRRSVPDCPDGVAERDLPTDCFESAATPGELFRKLDDWGHEAIVIPHGTTWGFYTPPGSTWDKQFTAAEHDPERQTLVEVFSGHGNSEEYRDFRGVILDADGRPSCPEPGAGYLPTCWRAGEIIRARCVAAGEDDAECDVRAATARQNAAEAFVQGFLTVPGATSAEWLDAGQCRDCFQPAFNYRPASSVQYMLALRDFAAPGAPRRFQFGFMASSDNHTARPGTGYKEYDRREMTEAAGAASPGALGRFAPSRPEPQPESVPYDASRPPVVAFNALEFERQSSFFLTGGLIAAHSSGRDRDAIWEAFERREVYGTSGPRILLWFDLLNDPAAADGLLPMGGEARMVTAPEFRVRALGSFEQKPGCPGYTSESLDPERIHHLCRGECYNPGDARRLVTRIEVVRIRPQNHPDEPVAELIEDPWRVIPCDPDPAGCTVTFSDPDFAPAGRDALYYARAIEEPSFAVNADNLRCTRDAEGRCIESNPCWGDYRIPYEADCLAETEERAWSSPVFVAFGGERD